MAKRWFHWVFADGSEGVLDNNDRTDWDHGISTTEIQLAPLSAVVCAEGSRDWATVKKAAGATVGNLHTPSLIYDAVSSVARSAWNDGWYLLDFPKPEAKDEMRVCCDGHVVKGGNPCWCGKNTYPTGYCKPEAPKVESEETQREYGVKLAMEWAEHEGQRSAFSGHVRTLMDEVKRLRAELDTERDWNKRATELARGCLASLYPDKPREKSHIMDCLLVWNERWRSGGR